MPKLKSYNVYAEAIVFYKIRIHAESEKEARKIVLAMEDDTAFSEPSDISNVVITKVVEV